MLARPRARQREDVRGRQILDVDVVANRGAVRGRVVGAVDLDERLTPSAARRMFGIRCVSGS